MEIYAAFRQEDYDLLTDSSTLFWGAVIFVALVALCLVASKAIGRSRNKGNADGVATLGHPKESSGQAISRPSADGYGCGLGNFASMIVAGEDDSSSDHPTRKGRKAAKARRNAT
jgi:hypothetical protein